MHEMKSEGYISFVLTEASYSRIRHVKLVCFSFRFCFISKAPHLDSYVASTPPLPCSFLSGFCYFVRG
jgi:hypothetical protein